MNNVFFDNTLADDAELIWRSVSFPQVLRSGEHTERLMVVFSASTQGWLNAQRENTIGFFLPGKDFCLSWIKDFKKIVLVHEGDFEEILTMIDLLHRIGEDKEFFRDKLFLLISRGRQPIYEQAPYEIREDEFIPIDVDELDRLPQLSLDLTPYASDCFPLFTDLRSWVAALQKNVLTGLTRNRLFPQLRNGLLETQRLMIQAGKAYIGGIGVAFERSAVAFSSQKGLFRHCIVPQDDKYRIPQRSADNCFAASQYNFFVPRYWFDDNRINDLGRDLMPHPDMKRPTVIPRDMWDDKKWKFHLNERRPLFPLLLWEGHHAKALSLECFIPPYNFHELIRAMKDVLAGLPPSELFPDIEGEKQVDVSDFRDGLGTVTLDAPCKNYQLEQNGRVFRVELASSNSIDKLFWNIEKPCGNIYRQKEDKKNTIRIQPDSEEAKEYVAGVLDKAVRPVFMHIRQILWDANRYRQFSTSELVRYYANSIAESFDGNRECTTRYLDMLNWKYAGQFPRHTRIIRHG